MPDYKKMYFDLFRKVARASELLTEAQREGEGAYIDAPAPPLDLGGAQGAARGAPVPEKD